MQPPLSRTQATDDTQRPPRPDRTPRSPSRWTGKEPLSTYTDSRGKDNWVRGSAIGLVATSTGVIISLGPGGILGAEPDGAMVGMFSVSVTFGLFALGFLLGQPALARVFRMLEGWSLRIGPRGIGPRGIGPRSIGPRSIGTTSAMGRREYRWSQVQGFAIKEVDVSAPPDPLYRYTGLHIKVTKDDEPSVEPRPEGWPPRYHERTIVRTNGLILVCALGPMTDRQWAELEAALARYGHQL
ncbi:hypothetical protein [Streptomyces inhibens]|uniref:hypothetical protein n=1 Tax=Streptomyces inhibens TaxID=2293571 RepID=UPI001EE739F4|nr:hypothetical protein [Streptomyces inhibens]UKY47978.1 hypothetical protein KI385_03545 [Streptomyces inhibens]